MGNYSNNGRKPNKGSGGYHGSSSSSENHISAGKQILRALLAVVLSLGFGAFWVAVANGIEENTLYFVLGIVLMIIGVIHIFIGIKKDMRHRK